MYYLLNYIPIPFMLLLLSYSGLYTYFSYETVMYFIIPLYLLVVNYVFLNNPKYFKAGLTIETSRFQMISVYLLHYIVKMFVSLVSSSGTAYEFIAVMFLWFFVDVVPPLFVMLIGSIFINPDR